MFAIEAEKCVMEGFEVLGVWVFEYSCSGMEEEG